jgi:hypothetical protein
MAVAFRTAVVHDSRRDAWRLVVKSVKISNGCIVLQSYFKKYKKISKPTANPSLQASTRCCCCRRSAPAQNKYIYFVCSVHVELHQL